MLPSFVQSVKLPIDSVWRVSGTVTSCWAITSTGVWTHIKLHIVRIELLLMFISSCVSRVHRDSGCHSNIWQRFWHWKCLQCWEATVNQSVSSFIQHMGGAADVRSMLTALLMQTDSELFLCNLQRRIWWEHKIPFVLPKINEWKHS